MIHRTIPSIVNVHAITLALMGLVLAGPVQADERVQTTRGRYMNHAWRIDGNHLIWWDDKPCVRYGFTGTGARNMGKWRRRSLAPCRYS